MSEASKRDILHFFNVAPEKIVVVYNAIDEHFWLTPPEEEVARVRERYQLDHQFVLYVGNIKPHKNLVRLIEAFDELRRTGFDELKLLIIGDEISKLPALRRAVHSHKLHKHVRFLGYCPTSTLRVLYRLAALFVFPSLYEGFGLPPLEAMASGTPVVTSNQSSLPEVTGDAAVLVDPYDVGSIVDGMRRVLTDPALAADLRRRGPARAREFSWARSVEKTRRRLRTGRTHASAGRAGPRLAHRHARRREGARGALRALSRRRHLHAVPPAADRCRRASSGTGSRRPGCSGCRSATRHYRRLPAALSVGHRALRSRRATTSSISSSHCVAKSVIRAGARASPLLLPFADALCVGSVRRLLRRRSGGIGWRAGGCTGRSMSAARAMGRRDGARACTASSPTRVTLPGGSPDTIIARASVVYPPVDTAFYRPAAVSPESHFLIVSALVPYKRIDLAIEACRRAGARLRIVGDGPERQRLERLAGRRRHLPGLAVERGDSRRVPAGAGTAPARRGRLRDRAGRSAGVRAARRRLRPGRRARNGRRRRNRRTLQRIDDGVARRRAGSGGAPARRHRPAARACRAVSHANGTCSRCATTIDRDVAAPAGTRW